MIKARFTVNEIRAIFDKKLKDIENAIIMRLQRLGDKCVNEAKENRGYQDQTGNLVSSIGYVVIVNGKIIKTGGFEIASNGAEGASTGREYAIKLAIKYAFGNALIVVAGMNYAFYVEATGRNVLSSAEHLAQVQLPIMMAQLKAKLK